MHPSDVAQLLENHHIFFWTLVLISASSGVERGALRRRSFKSSPIASLNQLYLSCIKKTRAISRIISKRGSIWYEYTYKGQGFSKHLILHRDEFSEKTSSVCNNSQVKLLILTFESLSRIFGLSFKSRNRLVKESNLVED